MGYLNKVFSLSKIKILDSLEIHNKGKFVQLCLGFFWLFFDKNNVELNKITFL